MKYFLHSAHRKKNKLFKKSKELEAFNSPYHYLSDSSLTKITSSSSSFCIRNSTVLNIIMKNTEVLLTHRLYTSHRSVISYSYRIIPTLPLTHKLIASDTPQLPLTHRGHKNWSQSHYGRKKNTPSLRLAIPNLYSFSTTPWLTVQSQIAQWHFNRHQNSKILRTKLKIISNRGLKFKSF